MLSYMIAMCKRDPDMMLIRVNAKNRVVRLKYYSM